MIETYKRMRDTSLAVTLAISALSGCAATQSSDTIKNCATNDVSATPVIATYIGETDYSAKRDPILLQKKLEVEVDRQQNHDKFSLRVDQTGLDQLVCKIDGKQHLTTVAIKLAEEK